jgi:hypothetical protein
MRTSMQRAGKALPAWLLFIAAALLCGLSWVAVALAFSN